MSRAADRADRGRRSLPLGADGPPSAGPRLATASLVFALAALAAWRGACVLTGPDADTDAYAHHMIARAILADPRDLAVHWVWLPLFHYAQVPLVALGGTMDTVRWINVGLSAALPAILYVYVRGTAVAGASNLRAEATALLAALFAAACPIAMQMGTTAQPEPLFALLLLGAAIAVERDRHGWTAALLGAAVMLRYEAWAALGVVGVLAVARRRGLIGALVPAALILAWAALRRPVDGRWFGFLGQTTAFANEALHESRGVLRDLLYYPVLVPFRVMGAALVLAPFGVLRTVRQQGARFTLVLGACLGFVTLTWMTRSTLGLDRHFVCVVPLYATFAAQGAAALGDALATRTGRARLGRGLTAVLGVGALAGLLVELEVWMGFWRASIARGWPDRAALARYLDELPERTAIACDDATIELLSHVDRRRFDRHWIDDPATWPLLREEARVRGGLVVATWRRKLRGHESEGRIVFEAGEEPDDPSTTGVAAMRIDGPGETK